MSSEQQLCRFYGKMLLCYAACLDMAVLQARGSANCSPIARAHVLAGTARVQDMSYIGRSLNSVCPGLARRLSMPGHAVTEILMIDNAD